MAALVSFFFTNQIKINNECRYKNKKNEKYNVYDTIYIICNNKKKYIVIKIIINNNNNECRYKIKKSEKYNVYIYNIIYI